MAHEKTLFNIFSSELGNADDYIRYLPDCFEEILGMLTTAKTVKAYIETNRPLIINAIRKHADEAYEQNFNGYKIINREDVMNHALDSVIEAAAKGIQVKKTGMTR